MLLPFEGTELKNGLAVHIAISIPPPSPAGGVILEIGEPERSTQRFTVMLQDGALVAIYRGEDDSAVQAYLSGFARAENTLKPAYVSAIVSTETIEGAERLVVRLYHDGKLAAMGAASGTLGKQLTGKVRVGQDLRGGHHVGVMHFKGLAIHNQYLDPDEYREFHEEFVKQVQGTKTVQVSDGEQ